MNLFVRTGENTGAGYSITDYWSQPFLLLTITIDTDLFENRPLRKVYG